LAYEHFGLPLPQALSSGDLWAAETE
jgi:hypothetical protein